MKLVSTTDNRIDFRYISISGFAVLFSWLLHEFAHFLTGTFLGYEMAMTLNKCYPLSLKYSTDSHFHIISGGGPLITLIEAFIIFLLMKKFRRKSLYPFLFVCFYMRFFATIISFLNPNDEARISKFLGLGKFTIPVIITLILFALLYKTSRSYGFSKKFNLANLGLVIFFSSIIILVDQFYKFRLM